MRPKSKPVKSLNDVLSVLSRHKVTEKVALLGVRGFFKEMGSPGKNDRGIYDDAIFLIAPNTIVAFNASTDPSIYRKGRGKGAAKGVASLKAGVYRSHRLGLHKGQYQALVQTAGPVTVIRDGVNGDYEDTGFFGINIHRGGIRTTSSLGCQTIPPDQWNSFMELVKAQMKRHNQKVVPYVLVEE